MPNYDEGAKEHVRQKLVPFLDYYADEDIKIAAAEIAIATQAYNDKDVPLNVLLYGLSTATLRKKALDIFADRMKEGDKHTVKFLKNLVESLSLEDNISHFWSVVEVLQYQKADDFFKILVDRLSPVFKSDEKLDGFVLTDILKGMPKIILALKGYEEGRARELLRKRKTAAQFTEDLLIKYFIVKSDVTEPHGMSTSIGKCLNALLEEFPTLLKDSRIQHLLKAAVGVYKSSSTIFEDSPEAEADVFAELREKLGDSADPISG